MQKSKKLRARTRRDTNRRNFLRLERLEDRMVLTGAAPIAFNDSFHTLTDQPLDISPPGILANDTDAEGDALSAVLFSGPAHGTLTMQPDGGFHYAPEAGFTGIDSFMYSAADDTSCSRLAAVTIRVGNGGVPVSQNDSFTVNEDNSLNISASAGVLHNDSDPDGDAMTAALVTGPTNGTVELASDGSFVYTPTANFHGSDSFVYQASDGTGTGNQATVTITVNSVNDVPTASNDAFSLDEDSPLTISAPGIMENDSDADGDSLTPSIVSNPLHGSITLGPDGSFTYTPAENFHGVDGFSYLVSDGTATSNVATVTLEVNSINDKPVGAADEYTTAEDTTLTIDAAAGVMGNDSDADGDSLIASLVSGPSHGTLTLNSDGSFDYTPEANFNGADSFSYTVNDGTIDSDPVVVTLTITPVNDNPIAVNDEYTIDEDTTLTLPAPGILGNDTDVDGDTLAASLVSGPIHGTLSMNADGSLTYTPEANFNGTDGFSYVINDGTVDSEVATVTINVNAVNDTPVAVNDDYTTQEDTPLTLAAPGILGNDTDADGDALTASLVSGPIHGSLTLNPDGSLTYTPEANFNGTDGFSYLVNDGSADSEVATVTINVTSVDDAPTAVNDEYATDEDTALAIDATSGLLANDSDPDSSTLTVTMVSGPVNGTITLNPDGSFNYVPNANFNGTDGFSYTVSDGSLESDVATVTINVNPIDDAPVAQNDAFATDEDTTLTVDAATGVLANDSDVEGDAMSAALVTGPAHGSLTLNADGSFSYTPEANWNGEDSFVYSATAGSLSSEATVTITVNSVNDAPVAAGDEYSVDEDANLHIDAAGVLANDTDADGDTLSAMLVTGPANGTLTLNADGSFDYAPTANFNGSDSFVYKANDGQADSAETTVTITVNAVNDAPTAEADSYSTDEDTALTVDAATGVLANDSDVDGDPMTAALVTGPAHGSLTLNADGSFSYTPEADWSGEDSFVYSATDGSLSTEATVTITVNSANDAPVAAGDEYSVDEDANLHIDAAGVLANDTDADGDALSAMLVTGPANGTLTLNADGSFDYIPTANFNGSDSFVYKANDGQADSAETTVTITVNSVNDAPTAEADSYTTDEDVPLTVIAPGVLGNDSDIEGDSLSAILGTGPAHGTVSLAADGSLVYTPEANFNGSDSFTYKVSDGSLESAETTVSITVNPIADAPLEHSDAYSTGEDVPLNVAADMGVLANDFDPLDLPLTAELVTGPTNGTLTLNADGSFLYTPNANFYGADSFTYVANNGVEAGPEMTASIVVQALNDAPSAVNDTYSLSGSGSVSVDIAAGVMVNDSDIDGDALTATMLLGPSHGTLTLNSDGSFTYVAAEGFTGNDSFKYQLSDGMANSNVATVWLNYAQIEENSPPTSQDDAYSVDAGTTLDIVSPGVLGNDSDADGDPLTAALISGPAHGALTLNVDGSFSYTPEVGFAGEDSFTYMASDGIENGNVSTVILTVQDMSENQIPDAKDDGYVAEGGTLLSVAAAEGVLANDTDADGDPLTAVLVDGAAHGTLTLNADGSFDYLAEAGFNGTDTFTYQASDGTGLSPIATVSIEVSSTSINQRPAAVNDQFTTTVDQPLTVAAPGLLGNDSDPDGDPLTVQLFSGPQNGTLTINGDGSFVYTPAAGFQGRDSFIYRVSDGEMNSALAAVTIYVNAVPPGSIVTPGGGSSCGPDGEGEGDAPAQLRLASTLRSGEFDWLSDDGDLDDSLLDDLAGKPDGEFGDIDSVLASDGWLL